MGNSAISIPDLAGLVTTKGDLLVATAAGVVVRHAVGADNQTLVADSTQTDGVRWVAGWTKIYDSSLTGVTTTGNITITGYRFIRFRGAIASTLAATASDSLRIRFNGDTNAVYSFNTTSATTTVQLGSVPATLTNTDRIMSIEGSFQCGSASVMTTGSCRLDGPNASNGTTAGSPGVVGFFYEPSPLAAITAFSLFLSGGGNFSAASRLIVEGWV